MQSLADRAGKVLRKQLLQSEHSYSSTWAGFVVLGCTHLNWIEGIAMMKRVLKRVESGAALLSEIKHLPPPILGFILAGIYEAASDETAAISFLREVYPKVKDFHRYLYLHCDSEKDGLLTTTPEENLLWPFEKIESDIRPFGLKEGFSLQDPLFNALLVWSNECLIEIGAILGEDVSEIVEWNELTIHTFNKKLWNEEDATYEYYDNRRNASIPSGELTGALPMIAEIPDQDQAEMILESLQEGLGKILFSPLPSSHHPFGPGIRISIPANWLLYHGLWRFGMGNTANQLRQFSLELMERYGFREIYDFSTDQEQQTPPEEAFLPTAALCIAWLMEE